MDEKLKEVFVSTERIYEGKIINLRRDKVCLPNGKEAAREVVEHPGAVAIVPVLPDGRILMVRQFRHPVGQVLLEIPAGKHTIEFKFEPQVVKTGSTIALISTLLMLLTIGLGIFYWRKQHKNIAEIK